MADDNGAMSPEDIFRLISLGNTGLDVGAIERSELINFKDIEGLLDSALFQQNAGATNPLAFQSTTTYETVALPQRPLFQQYSQAPTGSIENTIALFIEENPHSPSTVLSEMEAFLTSDRYKTANPTFADRLKNDATGGDVLARELAGIKGQIDDISAETRSYNTEYAALEPEAQAAADDGLPSYQKATETPSEAAKRYTDRGLSTPDDRYEQSDFYDYGPDGGRAAADEAKALFDVIRRRRSGVDDVASAPWVDPRERVAEPFGPSSGGGFKIPGLPFPQWSASPDALRGDDAPNDEKRIIEAAIARSKSGGAPSLDVPLPPLDPSTLDQRPTSDGLPSFGGPRGRGDDAPDGRGRVRSDEDQRLESVQAARWAANVGPLVQKKVWDRELTDEEKADRSRIAQSARLSAVANQTFDTTFSDWAEQIGEGNRSNFQTGEQYNNEDNVLAQMLIARANANFDQENSARKLAGRNAVGATPLSDQLRAATGGAPNIAPKMPSRLGGRSGGASSALAARLAKLQGGR